MYAVFFSAWYPEHISMHVHRGLNLGVNMLRDVA